MHADPITGYLLSSDLPHSPGDQSKSPSVIRRWLGDYPRTAVFVDMNASPEEKVSISAIFPEADICDVMVFDRWARMQGGTAWVMGRTKPIELGDAVKSVGPPIDESAIR
jgi:hypothetical protein